MKRRLIAVEAQRGHSIGCLASHWLLAAPGPFSASVRGACNFFLLRSSASFSLLPPPNTTTTSTTSDFKAGRPTRDGKHTAYSPFHCISLTLITAPRHPRQRRSVARHTGRAAQPHRQVSLWVSSPIPSYLAQEMLYHSSQHPRSCATVSTNSSAGVVPCVSRALLTEVPSTYSVANHPTASMLSRSFWA